MVIKKMRPTDLCALCGCTLGTKVRQFLECILPLRLILMLRGSCTTMAQAIYLRSIKRLFLSDLFLVYCTRMVLGKTFTKEDEKGKKKWGRDYFLSPKVATIAHNHVE